MRTLFGLLALSFSLLSCQGESSVEPDTMEENPPAEVEQFSYLALGDSYTIGESVDPADRWPVQLAAKVRESGIPLQPPTIVATTGWTTAELSEGIAARGDLDGAFDVVSLLIGVNNQYRGQSLERYRPEFTELLEYAIEKSLTGKEGVFVVSIPDYAYTPFGAGRASISEGVDAFNAAAEEICSTYGITFLNITPISRRGLEEPELVASDKLHPSGEQYRLWVEEVILPFLLEEL